ncbi:MAG: hypothetical protein WC889_15070, partial [Myxococcota bacterium]
IFGHADTDAGVTDAGAHDAGVDAGASDAGIDAAVDAGADGGVPDGGAWVTDAGTLSECHPDAGGVLLEVTGDIRVCLPPVVCTSETCPPELGDCVLNVCQFKNGYLGLLTLPQAWATYYCQLDVGGCHGVTQINYPEVTASIVAANLSLKECFRGDHGATCVGIMAAPPMMVGNSQEAIDPSTGHIVKNWGLGMTEASGGCYEVTGPGGKAILAVTDRCGGYCKCNGSGYQECGPCVSAPSMSPHCSCVGTVPGLFTECCGNNCPTLKNDCDWCASNNHPHFDMDTSSFNWVCGAQGLQGSCQLSSIRYVRCANPLAWPPGGGPTSCGSNAWDCTSGGNDPVFQPLIEGTHCCCNWGKSPIPPPNPTSGCQP